MSGSWNIENVADSHELWVEASPSSPGLVPSRQAPDGHTQWLDPVTAILIWTLPVVGVGGITERNLDDTFLRLRMLELASGPLLIAGGQPEFIELKHLRRRIGLRVDARISLAPLEDTLIRELRKRAQEALKESMHPA